MEELYWITRFDALNNVCTILFTISIIIMVASIIILIILYIEDNNKEYIAFAKFIHKLLKSSC